MRAHSQRGAHAEAVRLRALTMHKDWVEAKEAVIFRRDRNKAEKKYQRENAALIARQKSMLQVLPFRSVV